MSFFYPNGPWCAPPRLKDCLRRAATPLALIVSEDIYWSIVRHDYEGIPESAFDPLVRVRVSGRRRQGWVHVPVPQPVLERATLAATAARPKAMIAA